MDTHGMQSLSILERATIYIENALNSFGVKKSAAARDWCMKGLALIDLLNEDATFRDCSSLKTCKGMLEIISKGLSASGQQQQIKIQDDLSIEKEPSQALTIPPGIMIRAANIHFSDIIGCDLAKQALHENVVLPLTLPSAVKTGLFKGIRKGSGNVLLHGPPGTGKTLLAQAAATEANAKLLCVCPSDILSKYQGESEKAVRSLFEYARSQPRVIIFFDEFDCLASARGNSEDGAISRRLLSEMLLQLTYQNKRFPAKSINVGDGSSIESKGEDGTECDGVSEVVVIAATNRLEDLDEAVVRRFESKIFIGPPDRTSRALQVLAFLQGVHHSLSSKDLDTIADLTFSWSGSDIEKLCREAAMAPIRSLLSFHHHRYRVGEEEQHHHHNGLGQVKEENARKRPKPLPTNAENIRCVTLSDFGGFYQMTSRGAALTIAHSLLKPTIQARGRYSPTAVSLLK